ncbi:unnamed protein product, partial [Prunus brigantina]
KKKKRKGKRKGGEVLKLVLRTANPPKERRKNNKNPISPLPLILLLLYYLSTVFNNSIGAGIVVAVEKQGHEFKPA